MLDKVSSAEIASAPAMDETLAEHVAAIRRLGKQTRENVVEIGRHLIACKRIVGRGNFGCWLDREFGWAERTAQNFMRVAEMAETANFADLDLPVSALYLLAAPSTPEAAREEIVKRAKGGERVPVAEVKQVIETEKGKTRRRRTSEEMRTARFKDGADVVFAYLEALSGVVVPERLSAEDRDWALEQIRCGEHALRAFADRIKQVRSEPTPKAITGSPAEVEPTLAGNDPGPLPDCLDRNRVQPAR
jgi:hypothetical protein